MLITVSGPPGGGKSTTAGRLAEYYGFDHVSGGDIFRSMAADRDMSLAELNERAESNRSIDIELDRRLAEVARTDTEVVLESRLAGWLAGTHADFRLWLDAPRSVRAARIADREGTDQPAALTAMRDREESEASRYRDYYDIDIGDRSIYDLVLNTGRWSPDAVHEVLTTAIDSHDPSADEGQLEVAPVSLPDG